MQIEQGPYGEIHDFVAHASLTSPIWTEDATITLYGFRVDSGPRVCSAGAKHRLCQVDHWRL